MLGCRHWWVHWQGRVQASVGRGMAQFGLPPLIAPYELHLLRWNCPLPPAIGRGSSIRENSLAHMKVVIDSRASCRFCDLFSFWVGRTVGIGSLRPEQQKQPLEGRQHHHLRFGHHGQTRRHSNHQFCSAGPQLPIAETSQKERVFQIAPAKVKIPFRKLEQNLVVHSCFHFPFNWNFIK